MSKLKPVSVVLLLGLLAPSIARACDVVGYADDRQRVRAEAEAISQAAVAIDGIVTRTALEIGSTALIRPTRVWFGPKQAEYAVRVLSDCSRGFVKGERVRIPLRRIRQQPGLISRFFRYFWTPAPLYDAGPDFALAMKYPMMRQALERRAPTTVTISRDR